MGTPENPNPSNSAASHGGDRVAPNDVGDLGDLDQCAEGGDLAHAIRADTATRDDVAATLADLAAGARNTS